jgi:hypothetical protein
MYKYHDYFVTIIYIYMCVCVCQYMQNCRNLWFAVTEVDSTRNSELASMLKQKTYFLRR